MLFLIGALAGLAYGLSGFGGSLLAVALLVLLATPITTAMSMNLCMLVVLATITAGDGVRARLPVPGAVWPFALFACFAAPAGVVGWALAGEYALGRLYPGLLALAAFATLGLGWRLPASVASVRGRLASLQEQNPRPDDAPRVPLRSALAGGGLAGFFAGLAGAGGGLFLVPALGRIFSATAGRAVACAEMAMLPALLAASITALSLGFAVEWRETGLMIFGALAGLSVARILAPHAPARLWHLLVASALLIAATALIWR